MRETLKTLEPGWLAKSIQDARKWVEDRPEEAERIIRALGGLKPTTDPCRSPAACDEAQTCVGRCPLRAAMRKDRP